MKGYTEQRGQLFRTVFNIVTGQFEQKAVLHAFPQSKPAQDMPQQAEAQPSDVPSYKIAAE